MTVTIFVVKFSRSKNFTFENSKTTMRLIELKME